MPKKQPSFPTTIATWVSQARSAMLVAQHWHQQECHGGHHALSCRLCALCVDAVVAIDDALHAAQAAPPAAAPGGEDATPAPRPRHMPLAAGEVLTPEEDDLPL